MGGVERGAPPRPPDFNVAPHVVDANALIDCTTRNRPLANVNIEMGGRGGALWSMYRRRLRDRLKTLVQFFLQNIVDLP